MDVFAYCRKCWRFTAALYINAMRGILQPFVLVFALIMPTVVLAAVPSDENYDDNITFQQNTNTFNLDGLRYTLTGGSTFRSVADTTNIWQQLSSNGSDYFLSFNYDGNVGLSSIKIEATDGSAFRLIGLTFQDTSTGNVTITPYNGATAGTAIVYNSMAIQTPDLSNSTQFHNITSFVISGTDLLFGLDDLDFASPLLPDTAPPAVSSIAVSGSPATNAASATFSVDFDESAQNISTDDFQLTTTGTAAGTISAVSASAGDPITLTVSAITGTGTIRPDLKSNTNIIDTAGNGNGTNGYVAAYTSGATHTVDRDAPAAPSTPDLAVASDSGVSATDNLTNDTTPTFEGTAEVGSTIDVISSASGSLGTTTTNGSGNWSFTAGAMAAGNHTITATATDAASNTSAASAGLSISIDTAVSGVSSTAPVGGAVSTDTSVDFTVNFGESVTGISTDDFALGTTGGATGTISAISASTGSSVTVTVSSISGNGTIKLNLNGSTNISDAAGNSGPAAYSSGTTHTVAIPTAADAPIIDMVSPGNGQVSVEFFAPGNNGGSAITGYTVTSNPGGITAGGNGFTTSPITVSGLTNGTAYTFTMTATNAIGTSAASAASSAVTPKANQTITFANPGAQSFGSTPTLTATSDSTLTVAFSSVTTGVCTVTSGGALTFVSAGSCTIHANQNGNASFNAAATVVQTFSVTAAAPGAPTIGTATAGNTQASVTFSAPASNGGANISGYTVTSNPGGLTGTGASSPISVNGLTNGVAYTFTVTATNSAGTSSASSASNSVTPAAPQTITFTNPGAQNFGTAPTLTASSSAGGGYPISFTSATTAVCTITTGGTLTFVTAGNCTINADQAGDTSFLAAAQVSQTFVVSAVVPGAPTSPTATAGNTSASIAFNAPVNTGGAAISTYTVTSNPGGLTNTGAASPITVSGLTNGVAYTFSVTATNSAGTGAASAASNSITPKTVQTITFNDPGTRVFGTTPTLTATATSALAVTFTSSTTSVCTITTGGALTFVTAGTCTINANQAGDATYLAAPQVSHSFSVTAIAPSAPTIGVATVTGATSISLTFNPPASNGGAAITGYAVSGTPGIGPVNVGGSPATISGLTTGQSYTFTVTATNSAGTSSASAASNTVVPANPNVAPVISGTPATTATAGVTYTFTPSARDADAGTTLTFSASGVPAWASFSSSSGTLSGTPVEKDVGISGSIVISVSDGVETARLPAFNITVQSGNKAPQINGSPATTVKAGVAYSFTPTASDADTADKLTFSISNKPGWASFSSSNGSLSGTPAQTDAGTTSGIVISVSDGKVSTSLAPFSLQVLPNTTPVASAGSSTLNEDEPASFVLAGTDADGDVLTVQIQQGPAHGSVSQSGDAWLYTPNKDYNGPDSLSFVVKDASFTSAAATYSFSVTAVNDAPQAVDDVLSQARSSNDQYVLSVLGNDKDVDGDTLTLAGATASVGSVTVSGASLNYTAPAQYTGPVELRYSVSDGKKGLATAAVSLTITGAANDQLPVITVPADVEVNATALYTRVQLGTATAVDKDGRRLRVSLVNGSLFFAPGQHKVYWQATDANNNTATKEQQVRVNPLVSLSKDQVVSEGSSVSVEVKLNGPAASYPVKVPYTVSGTAGGNDHTLVSGTVEISSGVSASLQFDVLEDAVNDSGETIVIALSGVNAGSQRSTTVRITESNVAPVLSLNSSQQGENRLTLSRTDGVVTLSALATDANATDVVSLVWQSSLPLAGSNANSRTFNPSTVEPGVYPVTVTATDNGSPVKSATAQLYLVVQPSLPVLGSIDSDGDLIPDNLEGFADEDRDGLPDYKDRSSECNVVPAADTEQQAFLVEGEPGACLRRGQQSIVASSGGLQLATNELELDTAARNIGGVFDFIAYNLTQAGQGYQVSFPQAEPIPIGAVYRKQSSSKGWVDFIIDSKNTVRSAPGERGFCPPPGDAAYTPGLTAGHWCVQVTVEDGGPNDADGIANAAIVDPGGVAVPVSSNQLPVAKADTATTRMNQAVVVKVLANDTDADKDTLSVTQAVANFGAVKIETDGSLTYTPAKDYVGADVVVYSIADGKGGTASSELTVTVRLNNVPVAGADSAATDDRTAISINVLANDSDADSDVLKVVSASATAGTVAIEGDNRLRYTPKSGFNGTDTISYRISDGFGGEASGQVTVTVTAFQTVTVNNKSSGGAASGLGLLLLTLLAFGRRCGLLLVVLTGTAQAGDWQLQLGAGQSKADQSQAKLAINVPADSIRNIDDSDTALSVAVQYQWFERLDLELGYQSFGDASVDLTATTLTPAQYHQAVQSLTPVLGNGVFAGTRIGLWQQYGWRLQLPLGLMAWKSDIKSTLNGSTLRNETDGTDLYYGLALQYLHDAHWSAGIAWQQYSLDPENVRLIQLTASYRF